jgi:hypothetical protein
MVVESLDEESAPERSRTPLIVAALLARRLAADLRILTRVEATEPGQVAQILSTNGIEWRDNIQFASASTVRSDAQIDVAAADWFVTASWSTTLAMIDSIGPGRLIHLVEDDERLFHPHGDAWLRCAELLNEPRLRLLIESRLLFDHLASGGIANLDGRACWFEPAFPAAPPTFTPPTFTGRADGRMGFLLHARPDHPWTLRVRGIEALASAIEEGHLDPAHWDLYFAGGGGSVTLPRGVRPRVVPRLSMPEHLALTRRMDAGLCLRLTPHPSHPVLDLAAGGAVVVTNRHDNKQSLDNYSRNIVCADPSTDSLSRAIGQAAALAADLPRREANYRASRFEPDWEVALREVLDRLTER